MLLRYAQGLDQRNYELYGTCFAPDAYVELAGEPVGPGVEKIVARAHAMDHLGRSSHSMFNEWIELDEDRATVETYGLAQIVVPPFETGMMRVRGLRYHDEFVRWQRRWVIQRHIHSIVWERMQPVTVSN